MPSFSRAPRPHRSGIRSSRREPPFVCSGPMSRPVRGLGLVSLRPAHSTSSSRRTAPQPALGKAADPFRGRSSSLQHVRSTSRQRSAVNASTSESLDFQASDTVILGGERIIVPKLVESSTKDILTSPVFVLSTLSIPLSTAIYGPVVSAMNSFLQSVGNVPGSDLVGCDDRSLSNSALLTRVVQLTHRSPTTNRDVNLRRLCFLARPQVLHHCRRPPFRCVSCLVASASRRKRSALAGGTQGKRRVFLPPHLCTHRPRRFLRRQQLQLAGAPPDLRSAHLPPPVSLRTRTKRLLFSCSSFATGSD